MKNIESTNDSYIDCPKVKHILDACIQIQAYKHIALHSHCRFYNNFCKKGLYDHYMKFLIVSVLLKIRLQGLKGGGSSYSVKYSINIILPFFIF